jgi:transposase
MPPGTLVPRDWLLDQLSEAGAADARSTALVDLTIRDLATMFGRRPSTVRAWVERGDFAGAYKLHGKEWRVPAESVRHFQEQQRH